MATGESLMQRLLIVSNRLPVSISRRKTSLKFQPSPGGLATGIASLVESGYRSLWIGWPGIAGEKVSAEDKRDIQRHLKELNCHPLYLTQKDIDNYYYGFCNRTIWPLFHYFTQYAYYDKSMWHAYQRVNKRFCDTVLQVAKDDDIVWVHDYQLMLLPNMLREKKPGLSIGFFLHIPFPSFEVFRLMPWRREILEGLLGADLIGFHSYDYVRHFFSSVRNRLGIDHSLGAMEIGSRVVRADTFPMGIDYDKYATASKDRTVRAEITRNRKRTGDSRIILSVDRLDYTKGILQRLESYDQFLQKYPEYREKVTLILVAVPSRTKLDQYRELKSAVDERIGRINGRHGMIGWTPVWYLYNSLPFHQLTALYLMADVALVTPVRDGMNLIAKEYIATRNDGRGVLILSEMTGAAKELSEAFIVNPNNMERIADTIREALELPEDEQISRNRLMQRRLKRYDVRKWADDFIRQLISLKEYEAELLSRKLTPALRNKMLKSYHTGKRRLIMLDYDGTLREFEKKPEDAVPDKEILRLLIRLSTDPANNLFIISGRDRETLGTWFKHFNIGLIAEHGVWIKQKGGDWELSEPMVNYWKEDLRPIMERYMDRTPGSFIEEKDYSLVWHYRNSNPDLAVVRARELKEAIVSMTSNLGLGVLEGNKVIEIKNAGINKGNAALKIIAHKQYDFVFAAGDDRTDEDIFSILPGDAYSIKVGLPPSRARFTLDSVRDVRALLDDMVKGAT